MIRSILTLLILCSLLNGTAQKNNSIVIRGYIENPKLVDSISLVIWKNYYTEQMRYNLSYKLIKLRLNHPSGYFEFKDTISGPVYLTIGQRYNHFGNLDKGVLNRYIGEPGDSITIFNFGGMHSVFYGPGKEKYECRYALDKQTAYTQSRTIDTTGQLSILNQYKKRLSPFIYETLLTDLNGQLLEKKSVSVNISYLNKESGFPIKAKQFLNECRILDKTSEAVKLFSATYASVMVRCWNIASKAMDEPKSSYSILKEKFKGLIREKILATYIAMYYENLSNIDSIINDALSIIKNQDYRKELLEISDSHAKGNPAYNFSLPDENGIIRQLSDFRGKVVFIDFWYTGCIACVKYHKDVLAPIIASYKDNKNIVFLTINIDDTKERWLKSIKSGEYTSPGSINLYTNGEAGEHPVINYYKVTAYPRPLLIDKEGKIFSTSQIDLRINPVRFKQLLSEAITQ